MAGFRQGLFSAGLNHAMHSGSSEVADNDDEWMLTKDGRMVKVGTKGGSTTDYLYDEYSGPLLDEARPLMAVADVQHSTVTTGSFSPGGYPVREGFGYRIHTQFGGHGLYDPSFDIMSFSTGFGGGFKAGYTLMSGKFMYSFTYRSAGQTTFAFKWMNQSKSFMFRLERANTIFKGGASGYRTHINWHNLKTGANTHIYLNPKYWKYSR